MLCVYSCHVNLIANIKQSRSKMSFFFISLPSPSSVGWNLFFLLLFDYRTIDDQVFHQILQVHYKLMVFYPLYYLGKQFVILSHSRQCTRAKLLCVRASVCEI